jgi:hypothetical protein
MRFTCAQRIKEGSIPQFLNHPIIINNRHQKSSREYLYCSGARAATPRST